MIRNDIRAAALSACASLIRVNIGQGGALRRAVHKWDEADIETYIVDCKRISASLTRRAEKLDPEEGTDD